MMSGNPAMAWKSLKLFLFDGSVWELDVLGESLMTALMTEGSAQLIKAWETPDQPLTSV